MRFNRLLQALAFGLLQQIPIMGPVIQAILVERGREASEQNLEDLIKRLHRARLPIEQESPNLIPALLMAEAELEGRLAQGVPALRRFLYLAANEYATLERTSEIAVCYGFLWRSYYNKVGRKISNVGKIRSGDLIALAYRVGGSQFRLLLPLVVTDHSPYTMNIDTNQFGDQNGTAFVWANDELSGILAREKYEPDPTFGKFTGLPVKSLLTDVRANDAVHVLQGTFRSPVGNNTIWPHDYSSEKSTSKVPEPVRDWIAGL